MEAIVFKQTLQRNQPLSSVEKGQFTFEGVNTSDEELSVKKSSTSCGCTSVLYPKKVKPGETFYVTLIIDKTGHKGNFSQSATLVYSNEQTVKLKVNGTIE